MSKSDSIDNGKSAVYENGNSHSVVVSENGLNGTMSAKITEMNFEDAFELTGHGKFNYMVLFSCGMILLNVTMESVGMGYVLTAAECDLHLTNQHKGLISAAAFTGIMCTSLLWGYMGDRIGRRRVMLPSIVVSAIVSVASSFSVNWWMLLVLRILTGCFISASSATVYAYLGEMHTNGRRGSVIAWCSAFISFAFILIPGLAWIIVPDDAWGFTVLGLKVHAWQVLMWWWCVPGVVAAAILQVLPESPRFLLARKSPEAALPVLAKIYAWNSGERKEDYPVKKIVSTDEASRNTGVAAAIKNMGIMFKPPLLRCVIISHLCMFAVFLLSSGLYMWVPDILNSIMKSTSEESISICQIIHNKFENTRNSSLTKLVSKLVDNFLGPVSSCSFNVQFYVNAGALSRFQKLQMNVTAEVCETNMSVAVFPISMGMGAVFAIAYLLIGFCINAIGRIRLFCGIMLVCGVATAASGFVPHGGAATALLILALCSGCAASILAAIAVDVFPTSMRAMAMCIMYMTGRAGAAVGSNVLGVTLDNHCHLAFVVIGAITSGAALILMFWPNPENVRAEIECQGHSY